MPLSGEANIVRKWCGVYNAWNEEKIEGEFL